jgi:hypothetical protein
MSVSPWLSFEFQGKRVIMGEKRGARGLWGNHCPRVFLSVSVAVDAASAEVVLPLPVVVPRLDD